MISEGLSHVPGAERPLEEPTALRPALGAAERLFPPAMVPLLREQLQSHVEDWSRVSNELLTELLTTVFFAGLETHEGLYFPIRVVCLGTNAADLVMPPGGEVGTAPVYRWKVLRFEAVRPFVLAELVKLAAARTGESLYTAVRVDGQKLAIVGLAREGFRGESDPFIEIVATRPGRLSVRSGREGLLEYELGEISREGPQPVLRAPPVRRALERAARAAEIADDGVADYIDTVRALVCKMAAHGRGGILVVSPDEHAPIVGTAPYRMAPDSCITSLLRLARRLWHAEQRHRTEQPQQSSYGLLLRSAFSAEVGRMIEEYSALTSIDGATVLSVRLALVAFGVILPLGPPVTVVAGDSEHGMRLVDLAPRGTRHRAAATYARTHPNSVVFVASQDGPVSCMLSEREGQPVLMWQLDPAAAHWGE